MVLRVDGSGQGVNGGRVLLIFASVALPLQNSRLLADKLVGVNDDSVLSRLLHLVDRHLAAPNQLLHGGGRIGNGADSAAHRQGTQVLVHLAPLPVDVVDLDADILRQVAGGKYVVVRQHCGKFLSAVAGRISALPHRSPDNMSDVAQGFVSLPLAVKLIVQLKIIHADDHQGQGRIFAALIALVHPLQEILPVQQPGEPVRAGLPVGLLIHPGVLDRNAAHRLDGSQERQVLVAETLPASLFPFLRAQEHHPHQLAAVLQGHKALHFHFLQLIFLFFPERFIFHRPLKIPEKQAVSLPLHDFHQRMVRTHGEIAVVQRTAAVNHGIAAVLIPQTDIGLFYAESGLQHGNHGLENLIHPQTGGNRRGILAQLLRPAGLLADEDPVKEHFHHQIDDPGGRNGNHHNHHDADGIQKWNFPLDVVVHGLGQVVKGHDADADGQHIAARHRADGRQGKQPQGVQAVEHNHRVKQAGENIQGEIVEHGNSHISQEQNHDSKQQGVQFSRPLRVPFSGLSHHEKHVNHSSGAEPVHNADLPPHVVHKGDVRSPAHHLRSGQKPFCQAVDHRSRRQQDSPDPAAAFFRYAAEFPDKTEIGIGKHPYAGQRYVIPEPVGGRKLNPHEEGASRPQDHGDQHHHKIDDQPVFLRRQKHYKEKHVEVQG